MMDDGLDIGKKDSVRMGGVCGSHTSLWGPHFIQDFHALFPLYVPFSFLTQVCMCKFLLYPKKPANKNTLCP